VGWWFEKLHKFRCLRMPVDGAFAGLTMAYCLHPLARAAGRLPSAQEDGHATWQQRSARASGSAGGAVIAKLCGRMAGDHPFFIGRDHRDLAAAAG